MSLSPAYMLFVIELTLAFSDGSCPTLEETGSTMTVTGGCTDSSGTTWNGSYVSVTSGKSSVITYSDFGYTNADGGIGLSGSLDVTALGVKGAKGVELISDDFSLSYIDGAQSKFLTIAYTDYALSGAFFEMLWTEPGSFTVQGQANISDMGQLSFSGGATSEQICASEYDSGAIVLEGSDTVTLDFDGAKTCDGCTPWTSEGGLSGAICEEKK